MDTRAIENFICEKNRIEMPDFQEQFALSYSDTVKILSELEKKGSIKYCGGFTYEWNMQSSSAQKPVDFIESSEDDERERYMEMRRRAVLRKMQSMVDEDEEDEEDEEEDDIEDVAKEHIEYIKKRRQEIIERIRREQEDEEREKKEDCDKTVAVLRKEIEKMPNYHADNDTFSLKMNAAYPNGVPFQMKIIEHGGGWYVSDCGNTIEYLSGANDKEKLIEYFKQTLKSENICLIDNAVCTTIDDIQDLSGEGSYLFKVVNGLINQEHFDMYYLGEDLVRLANELLAKEDAEMLVKALEVIDDPVRVSVLQKGLHIGYARSCRIIDTLTELGILVSDGSLTVKTDKLSSGFISYLKRISNPKSG